MQNKYAHFQAQLSGFVLVMTVRCATYEIEAKASPRNPYVVRRDRSENVDSFEVVKRSARMGRSSFCTYECVECGRTWNERQTHAYSTSIVLDLKQFHATIFDSDAYRCSASVQTVFE